MSLFRGAAIAWCVTLAVIFCCLFARALFFGSTLSQWIYGVAMIAYAAAFVWIASRPWPTIDEEDVNNDDNPFGEYEKCGHAGCTICDCDED